MSAHSTVMSPWSGKCSSHRFCTSRMRTSRDFCAASPATYKFLTGPCGVLPSKTTRANTLRQRQFRTKKQYCFPLLAVSPSFRTLAGIVVLCVTEKRKPGRTSRIRFRPVMNTQHTADNVLIDLHTESQRDLLSNAGTTPAGIPPFHCHDGLDEVLVGSLRAGPTAAPRRKQHAVLP